MKEKIDEVAKVSTELLDELIGKLPALVIKDKSSLIELDALQSLLHRSIKAQRMLFTHFNEIIEKESK